jgi:hypothetical protein
MTSGELPEVDPILEQGHKVLRRTDCKVDGAVDLGRPGTAVALPATVDDDARKFQRSL